MYSSPSLKFIIPVLAVSAVALITMPKAMANDCSLMSKPERAIKCLQSKVDELEKKLKASKTHSANFPKGAVIEFNAKVCPMGWTAFPSQPQGIVNLNGATSTIRCEKV